MRLLDLDGAGPDSITPFDHKDARRVWAARQDARRAVFAYLSYHIHDRLHSTLEYRTPRETRVGYCQGLALVA
ncbi:hypothetical protein JOF56_009794 [Kibdelosporangium banguiense]|uniref:Uncharacterized protein n=1 Tax=Kibdelosporangium banguiense TaxID=1365924 RepID=A0ABS4TZL4_9PSEU|nr:hypothetical protein [Kibdelosporangium banguiense]